MDSQTEQKKAVKIFISYAHADAVYYKVLIEGIKKHAKHSRAIEWNIWDDTQIIAGQLWHEAIKEKIDQCDYAILLVSGNFLYSDYIKQEEFSAFIDRQRSRPFHFFPVMVSPCDITQWKELGERQFFKPTGEKYGRADIKGDFTYADLVAFGNSLSEIPPNPNRERYHIDLVTAIENAIITYATPSVPSDYFRINTPAQALQPKDLYISNIRAESYTHSYWPRPVDHSILDALNANLSIIILGNSLAGKTRALYEALKKMANTWVLIPFDKPNDQTKFALPSANGQRYVAVLDDIDEFLSKYTKEKLEVLIHQLWDANVLIAATCRRGDEYWSFSTAIAGRIRDGFKTITIEKMADGDVTSFIQYFNRTTGPNPSVQLDKKAFDHNIGSYFMELTTMKARYRELEQKIRNYHLPVPQELPREILKALKYFYYTENMVGKSRFVMAKIKDFCQRRCLGKAPAAPKKEYTPQEWRQALEILSDTQYELNFIEIMEPHILVEEVYWEQVVEPEFKLERILGILEETYPSEDMQAHGFMTTVYAFTRLLNRVTTQEQRDTILEKMKSLRVTPDEVTFNSLIHKAQTLADATPLLATMTQAGLKPNEVTFNSLINKAQTLAEATELLETMTQAGLKPNEVTFTSLINKAQTLAEATALLATMTQAGLKPNEVTFTSLINKAQTLAEATALLATMTQAGLKPNEVTFTSLINKAQTFSEATALLATMTQAGLKPDEVTFTSLINKAQTLAEATPLLATMTQAGLKPNEVTFTSLINKAQTLAEATALLATMTQAGLKPDEVTFTSLINKAQTLAEATPLLATMTQAGLKPNEVTFTSLINKAQTLAEATALLATMTQAGLKPDEVTFTSLINKAQTLAEATPLLATMTQAGLKPDEVTFTSLINKAQTLAEATPLLATMTQAGLKPNEVTFNSLINKAQTLAEATALLETMTQAGLKPDEVTFSSLINKAQTLAEANALLKVMKQAGLKPDEFTFTSLINKAQTLAEATPLLATMTQAGLKPNEVTFNSLINKAQTLAEATPLLATMTQAGLKPNEVTFTSLINKAQTLAEATPLLETMIQAGLKPNVVTYTTLIGKAPTFAQAITLLESMKQARIKPNDVTQKVLNRVALKNPLSTMNTLFSTPQVDTIFSQGLFNTTIAVLCQRNPALLDIIQPHLPLLCQQKKSVVRDYIDLFEYCHAHEQVRILQEALKGK